MELRAEWEKDSNGPKNVCDTYGPEHLARLLGKCDYAKSNVSTMLITAVSLTP